MNRYYQHYLHTLTCAVRCVIGVALSLLLSSAALAADGGVQLNQTRVVFKANAKNAQATIKNQSALVYLVKAEVLATPDHSGVEKGVEASSVPFMVTPPLFRLEPNSQSSVLIVRNGSDALPTDRESVFYLSLLAIPATSKLSQAPNADVSAQVSVGIQTVIKLFYRPERLPMPVQVAAEKLTFGQQGEDLQISNPTPYYVTLARLTLDGRVMDVRDSKAGAMIPPFSTQHYPITRQVKGATWTAINDYGGESVKYRAVVSPVKEAL